MRCRLANFAGPVFLLWGLVPAASGQEVPLFSRHVQAVFSRAGCNAGTCHGAVQGKNGFRLSLFGAKPELDHAQLTRDLAGRRLDPLSRHAVPQHRE